MEERQDRLIQLVEEEVRATDARLGIERLHPRAVEALRAVPRHRFVPEPVRFVPVTGGLGEPAPEAD